MLDVEISAPGHSALFTQHTRLLFLPFGDLLLPVLEEASEAFHPGPIRDALCSSPYNVLRAREVGHRVQTIGKARML